MIKIVTVIGARPQFVKAAVLSRAFNKYPDIKEVIVHSGQHYDASMSDVFFSELDIPQPQYKLWVNRRDVPNKCQSNQEVGAAYLMGTMMQGLENVLLGEHPDWVLVYGDTDTTLAAALTAFKLNIPVIHVEAGLRSFNMSMPEEGNRILTDRMSRLLFCPTDMAVKNLEEEGFARFGCHIFRCGDVMQDAALYYAKRSKAPLDIDCCNHFVICTVHRNENTSDPSVLKGMFEALEEIAKYTRVILPLHPGTRQKLLDLGFQEKDSRLEIIAPVGYLEMVHLLKNSDMVLTDSGGLQKEAYFFRKPCITLRTETEWVELVEKGCNFLAGTGKEGIVRTYHDVCARQIKFPDGLYGNGDAGNRIVDIIHSESIK